MKNTSLYFELVNGEWSDWSGGMCSVSCGNGDIIRKRTCRGPLHDGKPCEGVNITITPCKGEFECPKADKGKVFRLFFYIP